MPTQFTHKSKRFEGLAVPATATSGSDDYVKVKQWAAMADDFLRMAHDHSVSWFDILDGNAKAIQSTVAAVTPYHPLLAAWMGQLSHTTKTARSAFNSVFRIWDSARREISEQEWLSSPEHAQNMISYGMSRPGDEATNTHLNGKLFTHYHDGSLNEVQPQQLWQHFKADRKDRWPNLILSSSHALVRDHNDVSSTMQGFHALIMHSFGDEQGRAPDLPLIRDADKISISGKGRQTLLVAAVHNHHNAWVNGGDLLQRLHRLDQLYEAEEQGHITTQHQREHAYLEGMSPAAIHLSRVMLSLIVTEPQRVPTRDHSASLLEPQPPLKLREDACEVLQHIKLAGYSKGGNIVTDAVRHLILQLEHEGSVLAPQTFDPQAPAAQAFVPPTPLVIASLVHNVGILAVNPGICPLTQREKDLGMRRIAIRNNLDRISGHLFRKHDREDRFGTHDDVYVINGKSMGDLGHGIDASLGTRDDSGYLTDESKVFSADILTLRLVRSRLQAFFASCYNSVGISHIHDDPSHPEQLGIEFSSGASTAQMTESIQTITRAFERAGLTDVAVQCGHDVKRQWIVSFMPPGNAQQRQQMLAEGLRHIHELNPNMFVSGSVYKELGHDPETTRLPDSKVRAGSVMHDISIPDRATGR